VTPVPEPKAEETTQPDLAGGSSAGTAAD
jgi:hypothetical protein